MAQPMAKDEALAARLGVLDLPKGGFTKAARVAALARLGEMGLPGKRDEYWRYTNPALLTAVAPQPAKALRVDKPIFTGIEKVRLIFTDGVFDAADSDDPALAGVEIQLLSQGDAQDIHWAGALYGTLETAGQTPVARPLAALNTAAAKEGLLIRVTGKADRPLHIAYRASSETSDVILHHVIKVDAGAEITVLETGSPGARANVVMEVDVGAGASFQHIRPQGRAEGRQMATHIFAKVAEDALFKTFTLSANGAMTRNEAVLELAGANAKAHIAGAAVGDGTNFHHDDTIFITHAAPDCESRQVFKKVLKNGATGVFQGKILVKQIAQKTDGYQISQALLLDGDSQFLCKPELEIYADDVKCSHGSTSGAIDETALFYLRSRGVPRKAAEALLVLSFVAEAIGEIEDERIADAIRDRLEDWLHSHGT